MLMNIINHPVEVNRVRIINQILDIVCLLAKFHPNSLDFIRQLQRWIGGIDWWRWLVKCQLARNIDQLLVPNVWQLESEAPALVQGWLFHSLDNKLAFLDCNIKISDTRKLTTAVYRKPTHTDHYLQFGSHHPLVHKLGVIRTLHYRAETVVSDQREVSSEKDHIRGAHCGYPNWAFEQAKKSNKDTKSSSTISLTSETSKRGTLVTIPYCAGLSERVKNTFKSYGISAQLGIWTSQKIKQRHQKLSHHQPDIWD